MKLAHHIWVTVHAKPEDDEEEILKNLKKFIPFNLEEQKLKIKRTSATSVEERKIIIFQIHLEKSRHMNAFFKHLNTLLTEEDKKMILKQKQSRLDEGNHFFIRFDKEKLVTDGEFKVVDHGNCFHVKISIATFPTTRKNALDIVTKIFS